MNLKSMTAFVLEQRKNRNQTVPECLNSIFGYADFLKQTLTLGMFVPCADEGNVVEKPMYFDKYENGIRENIHWENWGIECEIYQKAKEKVLFEGFYIHHTFLFYPNGVPFCDIDRETLDWVNIEWLLNNSFQDLRLTPTAIKQIQP